MASSDPIDHELIRKLAQLLNEEDLSEIEVEHDLLRVRITKSDPASNTIVHAAPAPVAAPATSTSPTGEAPASETSLSTDALKSPMVGTAYLAPEPGAAAFVKVGDRVKADQTVLIIEAMKTMNQIPAGKDGVIKQILVEDAQPVEYGEPLLVIE